MLTQYAFSILFIDKKKAKFSNDRFGFMDKKYLYYAFHAMITEFYRKSHGSGMIHITRKQFEEITLWLPPLTEQYRIVQYLQQIFEKLDSIVENL